MICTILLSSTDEINVFSIDCTIDLKAMFLSNILSQISKLIFTSLCII
ncbi:MAG: hypothetical protein ACKPKO_27390 [Candidatus Fonsibacter sp.]